MLSEATPMHTASERLKRVRDVQTGSYNTVPNSNTDGVTKVWPLKMYHRFVWWKCTIYCMYIIHMQTLTPLLKIWVLDRRFSASSSSLKSWRLLKPDLKKWYSPTSVTLDNANLPLTLAILHWDLETAACDCGSLRKCSLPNDFLSGSLHFSIQLAASILWTNAIQNKHEDKEVF